MNDPYAANPFMTVRLPNDVIENEPKKKKGLLGRFKKGKKKNEANMPYSPPPFVSPENQEPGANFGGVGYGQQNNNYGGYGNAPNGMAPQFQGQQANMPPPKQQSNFPQQQPSMAAPPPNFRQQQPSMAAPPPQMQKPKPYGGQATNGPPQNNYGGYGNNAPPPAKQSSNPGNNMNGYNTNNGIDTSDVPQPDTYMKPSDFDNSNNAPNVAKNNNPYNTPKPNNSNGGYGGPNTNNNNGGYGGSNTNNNNGGYGGSNTNNNNGGYGGTNTNNNNGGYGGSNATNGSNTTVTNDPYSVNPFQTVRLEPEDLEEDSPKKKGLLGRMRKKKTGNNVDDMPYSPLPFVTPENDEPQGGDFNNSPYQNNMQNSNNNMQNNNNNMMQNNSNNNNMMQNNNNNMMQNNNNNNMMQNNNNNNMMQNNNMQAQGQPQGGAKIRGNQPPPSDSEVLDKYENMAQESSTPGQRMPPNGNAPGLSPEQRKKGVNGPPGFQPAPGYKEQAKKMKQAQSDENHQNRPAEGQRKKKEKREHKKRHGGQKGQKGQHEGQRRSPEDKKNHGLGRPQQGTRKDRKKIVGLQTTPGGAEYAGQFRKEDERKKGKDRNKPHRGEGKKRKEDKNMDNEMRGEKGNRTKGDSNGTGKREKKAVQGNPGDFKIERNPKQGPYGRKLDHGAPTIENLKKLEQLVSQLDLSLKEPNLSRDRKRKLMASRDKLLDKKASIQIRATDELIADINKL